MNEFQMNIEFISHPIDERTNFVEHCICIFINSLNASNGRNFFFVKLKSELIWFFFGSFTRSICMENYGWIEISFEMEVVWVKIMGLFAEWMSKWNCSDSEKVGVFFRFMEFSMLVVKRSMQKILMQR